MRVTINVLTTDDNADGRIYSYAEIHHLVGGYDPISVINACAEMNVEFALNDDWSHSEGKVAAGWNLAEIRRMAMTSNRGGTRQMNQAVLQVIGGRTLTIPSSLADNLDSDEISKARWIMRDLLTQFPFQTEYVTEVMRTLQILLYTRPTKPPHFIVPGWDSAILGASLMDYLTTLHMIRLVGLQHGNRIGMSSFDNADDETNDLVNAELARQIFQTSMATTVEDFALLDQQVPPIQDPDGPQYRFNMLRRRPYVKVAVDTWVSPVNALSMMKATTSAIFYEVPRAKTQAFGADLGNLFEQYVGEQLQLIDGADVRPEREFFNAAGERNDTIDWTLGLPNLTVLVEAKALRPIASMTSGGEAAIDDLKDKLNRGMEQLRNAYDQWQAGQHQYDHISPTNPVVGLLVTLEDFHLNDIPLLRGHLVDPGFPVSIVSARELELLTSVPSAALVHQINELRRNAVDNVLNVLTVLSGRPRKGNKLLRQASQRSGQLFRGLFEATY